MTTTLSERQDEISARLTELAEEFGVPGAALAIARDDEMITASSVSRAEISSCRSDSVVVILGRYPGDVRPGMVARHETRGAASSRTPLSAAADVAGVRPG